MTGREADILQSVMEALPQPLIVIGADERIAHVNAASRKLLGEGAVGRHFITALRQPMLLDAIEMVLRDHAPCQAVFHARDDGQDVSFQVRCAVIEQGAGRGVMLSFEDITHLAVATQMRRDFVANVSHELKTPLTALMGFIETMRHGPAREDAAARERFLGIMDAEAGRMNRLVGDLLSLNRVEATERMRPTGRCDLVALVHSVASGLERIAAEAGVAIETELPVGEVMVPADEDQLRQVLVNLIENALKYGAEGRRVHVGLGAPAYHQRLRGQGVELSVRDFGAGIDVVHIPRLTERFYRADSHRSRAKGGTGLGLAIVKHIVNRHRGRIVIESAQGKGAVFRVLLPV